MISLTGESSSSLCSSADSTLCRDIHHPFDTGSSLFLLSSDLGKSRNCLSTWSMYFNPEKSCTLTLSLRKDHTTNPPIYFLNNPLSEIQALLLFGLTLSHDLSWACHISKLAAKARCRLCILRHAKSFLGTPELLSTNKAFILSLMECWSQLCTGNPVSYLSQLDTMESKAFKITGISRNEAESMGLSLHHRRQVGGLCLPPPFWSCILCPLCALSPPSICRMHGVDKHPPPCETAKIQKYCSLHSFVPLFPTCGTNFHTLKSNSSQQVFKTAVHHHLNFASASIMSTLYVLPYPSSYPASLFAHLRIFSPSALLFAFPPSPACCSFCYVTSWSILCSCSSMSLNYVLK